MNDRALRLLARARGALARVDRRLWLLELQVVTRQLEQRAREHRARDRATAARVTYFGPEIQA